jgi:putative ABC transport system permease protein
MFQDLRYGVRTLLKTPGFTLIAIITLALGIGANTAIFSVVNALMLRPLPYPDPERLVWVDEVAQTRPNNTVFGAHYLEWREQCQTVEGIAAYANDQRTLIGAGEPERVVCGEATENFFPLLGAHAFAVGRNFTAAEDKSGGEHVVVLSHELWQRRYNGDPEAIGKTITLDEDSYTIIGVLPADFRYFRPFDLWTPLKLDPQVERGGQKTRGLETMARLKPGVSLEQARAEMETIRQRYELNNSHALSFAGTQTRLIFLQERLLGDTRRALLALAGAVGLILLIACANVANLLLTRAAGRAAELAIRSALGAGRFRLVRQMMTECLLLAGAGGGAGLLLAYWGAKLLGALNSNETVGDMSRLVVISIDRRALGFTLLLSLLAALFSGLAPALQLSSPDLNSTLKDGARGVSSRGQQLRGALMLTEVALAVALLIGAGLLIRSFIKLLNVDQGFRAENVLTARLSMPARYDDRAARLQFYERILDRITAAPGVTAVGASSLLPLTTRNLVIWLRVEGRPQVDRDREPPVFVGAVNPDFFRVMGIGLRSGRLLNDGDRQGAPSVALLTESLARKLFPNEDPIGKRISAPTSGADWSTIVGVVGDVRHKGLDRDLEPTVYLSYRQAPPPQMALLVKSSLEPMSFAPALRSVVQSVDPAMPIYDVMTMDARRANSAAARRFNLMLLGALAALALLLAAVGIYGVISYVVAQRTREIGIRMALGAQHQSLTGMFVRHGLALTGIGVACGLVVAIIVMRLMSSLLFKVSPVDPVAYGAASLGLVATAFLASYLPSRRASTVDPVEALRAE